MIKSKGEWLPEVFVLSVLLHELSHCTNMHHGRSFWSTLALYKTHMQELISKRYTGEGFWSRGRSLHGSESQSNIYDVLPLQICGGTYRRSRRAKKQIKTRIRSIPKRFDGSGEGIKIGSDLERRLKVNGKITKGKPRVTQSKRGNELRLNAALARAQSSSSASNVFLYSKVTHRKSLGMLFLKLYLVEMKMK